jgi:hypothetical protein
MLGDAPSFCGNVVKTFRATKVVTQPSASHGPPPTSAENQAAAQGI